MAHGTLLVPRLALALLLAAPAPVDAEELVPARTHALIVGVLDWKNNLTPYSTRHRKDQELHDLLVRRGTPAEHIALLLDEEATAARIRGAVSRSARAAGPGTTLLVYYAGHGMPLGAADFCFAPYDLALDDLAGTGWSLRELGEILAREFRGERVLLCADCCYSGGLGIVVDRLAEAGIAAAHLTSASCANTSTSNWTFTQSLIDGLSGESLVDANHDGEVTLGEVAFEVEEAMRHLEGQLHGYQTAGIPEDLVLAAASGARADAADPRFALGSYVVAPDGNRRRTGRVIAIEGGRPTVQFYDYTDKRTVVLDADQLTPSTRVASVPRPQRDAGKKPDCEVEWQGSWWAARILEKKEGRYLIHYLGYEDSWDEWVPPDRIRIPPERTKQP